MPVAKVTKLSGQFTDREEENDVDQTEQSNEVTGGFTCEFVEHSDGSTSFRLFGDVSLPIRTAPIDSFKKVPEKADGLSELYVSPVVRNPQIDLRSAMEWTGRQLAVHAVTEAWNAVYPPERGGRESNKAKLEAITAENAQKDAIIAEMMSRLGISSLDELTGTN